MTAISRMYDLVRAELGFTQETVTLNLVPYAAFRFASRSSQAQTLERLCEELSAESPHMPTLRTLAGGVSDVFADQATQRHFTQHDALLGDPVVLSGVAQGWSMALCCEKFNLLQQLN